MTALDLSHLPDLPQRETICEVVAALWQQAGVIAVWLGGSLARGAGDAYSDVTCAWLLPRKLSLRWKSQLLNRYFGTLQ